MHFLTVVLLPQAVPPAEGPLYEALHHRLKPSYFDVDPEGPLHKAYYDVPTIEKVVAFFGVPSANLPEIAATLRQDWGADSGVDEHGLYELTTLNLNR